MGSSIYNVDLLPYHDTIKSKLRECVDLILNELTKVDKIILFGSYSRMEQTIKSDLDILVLTEETVDREQQGHLCSIFDEKGADLVFYTTQTFSESDCLFVKEVRKDGVLLWKK